MNERKVPDFLYEDLSYQIRGCVFSVYNVLGFGHKESIYQQALALEFKKKNIPFEREKTVSIRYEEEKVGIYRPDFVVDGKVLVELKAVPFMPKDYETQLTYYLKGSDFSLGFLINFGGKYLDIRRRVWTPYQRSSA
jgi:GxxExxY protein